MARSDGLYDLLKRLTEAFGISGYEDEVRGVIVEELRGAADKVWVDRLGNVIAYKKGSGGGLRVLWDAHMDEIGFFVRYIDDKGFIYLSPVGGWWDPIVLGQRVRILTDSGSLVYGVVGSKPPHLLKQEEREKVVPLDRLFVDIGASSREEVEKLGIHVGSPVDLDRETIRLQGDRVTGKAMDDRAGVAAIIEAFKSLDGQEADVYLVAAVQEEVGLKGARVAAYSLSPDIGLAVDVTTANDVPGAEPKEQVARVGGGPALTVADGRASSGLITHPKLLRLLEAAAREAGIPYQLSILPGGTTDGAVIALTREGVPTATISIPTRYIHSPVEVLSLSDVEYTARLLVEATKRLTREWYEREIGSRH
ncbi:MAG: M42 family metallopeptidase [Desulfurococcales archaeon]|nr:M42 family metallopeptidase [Desulfurococcales archaeon]